MRGVRCALMGIVSGLELSTPLLRLRRVCLVPWQRKLQLLPSRRKINRPRSNRSDCRGHGRCRRHNSGLYLLRFGQSRSAEESKGLLLPACRAVPPQRKGTQQ